LADNTGCGCGEGCACGKAMTRRQFLGLAAGAAGVSIFGLPGFSGASPDHKLTKEELQRWLDELWEPGTPLIYTASENPLAAMPIGGIGCGNVYLGVDGALKDWLIFNNVNPVQVADTFFAVSAGGVTRLLQTEPLAGVSVSGVKQTQMRGEYPFAFLSYQDAVLPVEVSLEAFSPMTPLDEQASAWPAAQFTFRVKNSSSRPQRVSLLMAARNSAGIGLEGGNFNRIVRRHGLTAVSMEIKPGRAPELDVPVHLVTSADLLPLDRRENPQSLQIRQTGRVPLSLDDVSAPKEGRPVYWLENPAPFDGAAAEALLADVRRGAVAVFSGASALLGSWALSRRMSRGAAKRPDILIGDFESGTLDGWTAEGVAFGKAPVTGTLSYQQTVSGWQGRYFASSFVNGDGACGKLVGRPFKIERRSLRFLIGGGSYAERTSLNLMVDGRLVRTASGRSEERLAPAAWDVSGLQGRLAHLEIVDDEGGGWGHVSVDEIVQTDDPATAICPDTCAVLERMLPCTFDTVEEVTSSGGTVSGEDLPDLTLRRLGSLRAMRLAPGADVAMHGPGRAPALLRRKVGEGAVYLLLAPLYDDVAKDRAERLQALSLLAAVAGGKYCPGEGIQPEDPQFGTMAIATTAKDAWATASWTSAEALLAHMSAESTLNEPDESAPSSPGATVNAALTASVEVAAGAEVSVPFLLTWRFPNYYFNNVWAGNHYARRWPDALPVAADLARKGEALRSATELYHRCLYGSTLPYWLLDCLTSQSSTIRSEVCIWTDEDAFAAYEGSGGCCPMNCSHVWGYEQTLSRLYPSLERRMRLADFKHQQNPDGGLNNRIALPLAPHPTGERPFVDGHASGILKAYREHLNSADTGFLRDYWPNIRKAVDYLLSLDGGSDGVLRGAQWNTYDCQVTGPNPFIGAYFLAALRAGVEMAKQMGDSASARRWQDVFERGRRSLVELTWNGDYFQQNNPDYAVQTTQFGPGCMSDQLIGQWWAHQLDLGYVLPAPMVKKALRSIFRNNWRDDLSDWKHNQRVFADGHDKGLICCTWPKGGRPQSPLLYCDEVWTGQEYQVAAHMAYDGMVQQALAIVAGARERYDGRKRNPWNEIECGGHYARALSSWSLLLALSGFRYDGPAGRLAFNPVFRPERFCAFFTAAEGWGSYSQERSTGRQHCALKVAWGKVRLSEFRVGLPGGTHLVDGTAIVHGVAVGAIHQKGSAAVVSLEGVTLCAGDTLELNLTLS